MTIELGMSVNGVEVNVSDFDRDLRGWVAFQIAACGNTLCRDKEALLKMLYGTADHVIEQVKTGKAP